MGHLDRREVERGWSRKDAIPILMCREGVEMKAYTVHLNLRFYFLHSVCRYSVLQW